MKLLYQIGFSLVELIITIAIIAILASVAVPSYNSHIVKSRRAEATINLTQAYNTYQAYYTNNNAYPTNNALLPPTSTYYTYTSNVVGSTYTLTATANASTSQANDAGCTVITLDQSGKQNPANCWQ